MQTMLCGNACVEVTWDVKAVFSHPQRFPLPQQGICSVGPGAKTGVFLNGCNLLA